jgi:hypothetical protein
MAFPSQFEIVEAIQQLKSYVELSDEDFNVVSTAALLLNIYAVNETNTTVYPGDIPQTIYLDAANSYVSVLYSRKYNPLSDNYTVTVLTLTGDPYIPVNPPDYILPSTAPIVEDKYGLIEVEYEALITTSEFTIGQQLSKIVIFVNGVPTAPVWVNNSTGVALTTAPLLPTQAKPTSDYVESLLEVIKLSSESIDASSNQTKLNTDSLASNLTTLIDNTDTVISALSNLSTTDTTGNAKLDTLISSLSNVGTSATSIDTKLSNLSTVTSTTTALATKLEDIKTQLTTLQSSLTTLNSSTTDNNLVVTNLDTNVTDLTAAFNTLSNKFTFQSGALVTDSSTITQPISAVSLPLPTGAATQTTLALVKTNTDKLDVNLSTIPDTLAKESGGNLDAINTKLPTLTSTVNGLKVDGSAVTQPISVTSLPLPNGAATASNQLDSIALETIIDSNINTIKNKLDTGTILVDGSAVTQPISVTSLPLPTGAANQTTLSSINTNIDTLVNVDFSTAAAQGTTNTRLQTIINTLPDLATTALQTAGNNSLTSIDGKLSGLATSSLQTTSNTLLTTISNKDFATEASLAAIRDAVLGNVNISESIWTDDSGVFFVRKIAFDEDTNAETVSFKLFDGVTTYIPGANPKPADTTLNITQPLTDTQLRSTAVPVSGSFYPSVQDVNVSSLPLPTGASTSSLQSTGNNTLVGIESSLNNIGVDITNIKNSVADIDNNTRDIADTNSTLSTINNNLDTINISVSTVNTSVGTTNTTLSTINNKVPTGLTVTANKLIVDGSSVTQPISGTVNTGLSQPLTDVQLRAAAVPVSGTFYPATQPVSATTLPLPTGAATNASLSTINTSVGSVKTSVDNLLTPTNNIKTNLDSIVTSNSSIDTKLPSGLTVTTEGLKVDGSSYTQQIFGSVIVSNFVDPLTNSELRASPVPVTMMSANTDIETVLLAINSVANVNVINGGSGYTNGSIVTFTGGTAVVSATATIITSSTGAVIGFNITNVGQYTVAPTGFTIAGGGTGCTGSIIMGSTVELVTDNLSTVRGYISNESVDGVAFEISLDGYNWSVTEVLNTSNNVVLSIATSSDYPLSFVANVAGTTKFRIRRTSIVNTITPRVFLNSSSDIAYIKTQTIASSTSSGLTDAQLRASPLPLPIGAATSALQTTGNTTLSTINGKLPALGQALATASVPVVLTAAQLSTLTPLTTVATTQSGAWTVTANTGLTQPLTDTQLRASAVPVSGTFFQATQPVSATALPLPSGASTSALQTTGNNSLSSINTKTPVLGQALTTASVPVVIASDQTVPVLLADRNIIGAALQHSAGANILAAIGGTFTSIDLSGYRSFSIEVRSSLAIANQWVLEGSNDNVTFFPVSCVNQANPNVTITGNITYSQTPITYIGRKTYRYLRARNISNIITGTTQAYTTLSPLDVVLPISVGLNAGSTAVTQQASILNVVNISTILSTAPTSTVNGAAFTPSWGTAISFSYNVSISNAGSNLIISVQESNNGSIWTDLHTWPALSSVSPSATFADTSPVFPLTSRFYRFVYRSTSNAGGTWNLTLSYNQLNNTVGFMDSRVDTVLSMDNSLSDLLNVDGKSVVGFTLTGTWSGIAQVQVTGNGINWSTLQTNNTVYNSITKTFASNGNITANGIYQIDCGGFKAVRLSSTSGGSGSAIISIRASNATSLVTFSNPNFNITGTLPAFAATPTVNIGTAPTIAVTGTFFPATQPISALSLPLPTGAATSAKQPALGTAGTASTDVITVQGIAGGVAQTITGTVTANAGTGTFAVSATTLPLPTGASTAALQTTGNTTLSTINNKLPVLGQALATGSIPVVLTAAQLSTLTPLTSVGISGTLPAFTSTPTFNIGTAPTIAVTGTFFQATQPVSLTTLPALAAGANAIGSITNTTFAATQSGAWNVTNITGTVSLPTGAATSALQTTGNTTLSTINTKIPALGSALSTASTPVVIASDQGVINSSNQINSYQPNPVVVVVGSASTTVDNIGRLETHSSIYSDEGSFRDDFSTTNFITTLTGTLNFTVNSVNVTGVGTSFITQVKAGQFIKKTADGNTLFVEVDSVQSNTQLTLVSNYLGTTGTSTAVISNWIINTVGTGTVTATTSIATLSSGVTAANNASICASADYPPFTITAYASISQRIANQTILIGLVNIDSITPNIQATVRFTGTSNTTCNFVTSSSAAASDIQTTVVTLPNGAITSAFNTYKIDVSNNRCTLTINGVVVAINELHIPGPYDPLNHCVKIFNTGAAASNTNLLIDYYYFQNVNRIQVDNDFQGEPQRVALTARTNLNALTMDVFADSTGALSVNTEGRKASYSAAIVNLVPGTTPTDIFTISGSATRIIRITRISLTANQTIAGNRNLIILKRSTLNTGGTSTLLTNVSHDSLNLASTAIVRAYTVNPTLGTLVGNLRTRRVYIGSVNLNSDEFIIEPGSRNAQSFILRSVNEMISINLNGVTTAGGNFAINIEFTEE